MTSTRTQIVHQYQIKETRSAIHIAGIGEASKSSKMTYALTACSALTRIGWKTPATRTYDNLILAVEHAETIQRVDERKFCDNCRKAAETLLAAMADSSQPYPTD